MLTRPWLVNNARKESSIAQHYNDAIMSVSNHQPHDCLLNRLFRHRSEKTSELRVTGLCVGNSPMTGEFPHRGPATRKMSRFDGVIMNNVCRCGSTEYRVSHTHDDVIKWKHFPRYWPFVWPVTGLLYWWQVTGEFPSQRLVARSFDVFFNLRLNLANNGDAGDFRRHRAHYDVTVMQE